MKFTGISVLFLPLLVTVSAYPLAKRDTTFNVNPLLLNVPFATVSQSQQGFIVGTTNVASLSDALTEVCKQHATSLQQALDDCKTNPTAQCNKLNGSPINSVDLTKENDQCLAHQLIKNGDGTFSPSSSILNVQIPQITQSGNTFTVGSQNFGNISDAVIGACKQQRTATLAKLDTCQTNPTAECTQLNGQPIARESVNKQNSVCFSHSVNQV